MSQRMILRPPSMNRQESLMRNQSCSINNRFGEVAGNATAECAAIFCCCPCGLVNLLVLAVYKLPAGLCRRALRKRRRQKLVNKGLLAPRRKRCTCGCDESELRIHLAATEYSPVNSEVGPEKEVLELEKEMWDRFYGSGFWRSHSEREGNLM